jgi:hypothetical protein
MRVIQSPFNMILPTGVRSLVLTLYSAASSNTIFMYSSKPYEGGMKKVRQRERNFNSILTTIIPSILIAVFS